MCGIFSFPVEIKSPARFQSPSGGFEYTVYGLRFTCRNRCRNRDRFFTADKGMGKRGDNFLEKAWSREISAVDQCISIYSFVKQRTELIVDGKSFIYNLIRNFGKLTLRQSDKIPSDLYWHFGFLFFCPTFFCLMLRPCLS